MTVQAGKHTYQEILTQGDAWDASLAAVEGQADVLGKWLRQPCAEVLFTGCGSPYYLSLAAAAIWQALTGIRAHAVPASELWLFPQSALPAQPSLLVAVSRSGATTEVLWGIDRYRERTHGRWLGVTCDIDSELARRAPKVLVAKGGEEQSVVQTRAFTSMLVLTQAAAGLAAGRRDYMAALCSLPRHVGRLIREYEPLARSLAQAPGLTRFVFLGSGPNYGLACEAMLKMKEMSLAPSEAFHFLEFRHGPKSVIGQGTLLVGLLTEAARDREAAVLAEMRDLGATVLAVSESADGLPADHAIALRSGIDELARGALVLPVLQLLAYHRALVNGLDPDRPAHLDAVVKLSAVTGKRA